MGLKYVSATLALNITGATAYATKVSRQAISLLGYFILLYDSLLIYIKFPERWFKRTFDIWGASHQLLHIFVVMAGLTHTIGVLRCFDYLHSHADQCAI
jgi:adiponectin receptor